MAASLWDSRRLFWKRRVSSARLRSMNWPIWLARAETVRIRASSGSRVSWVKNSMIPKTAPWSEERDRQGGVKARGRRGLVSGGTRRDRCTSRTKTGRVILPDTAAGARSQDWERRWRPRRTRGSRAPRRSRHPRLEGASGCAPVQADVPAHDVADAIQDPVHGLFKGRGLGEDPGDLVLDPLAVLRVRRSEMSVAISVAPITSPPGPRPDPPASGTRPCAVRPDRLRLVGLGVPSLKTFSRRPERLACESPGHETQDAAR